MWGGGGGGYVCLSKCVGGCERVGVGGMCV